jgi:hypothetical protein
MRHSKIDLTMNVYTDPRLLDITGAVERLPSLPLDGTDREAGQATGTDGKAASLSPPLCPPISPLRPRNLCLFLIITRNRTLNSRNAKNPRFLKEKAGFPGFLARGG